MINIQHWLCIWLLTGHLLLVGVEGGEGETLALVLAKELALVQADVVHLVGRAAAVGAVPLVG